MAASLLARLPLEEELRVLYHDAQNPANHEYIVRRFWTALIGDWWANERGLRVVAEQAPDHGRRRVDAIAYRIQQGIIEPKLYVEFKRARGRNNERLQRRHRQQVTDYCRNLLRTRPHRDYIYAMLCYGTQAQVWRVRRTSRAPVRTILVDADRDVNRTIERILAEAQHL